VKCPSDQNMESRMNERTRPAGSELPSRVHARAHIRATRQRGDWSCHALAIDFARRSHVLMLCYMTSLRHKALLRRLLRTYKRRLFSAATDYVSPGYWAILGVRDVE